MKQEVEVRATEGGRVKEILVKEWDEMDVDTPMIILEQANLRREKGSLEFVFGAIGMHRKWTVKEMRSKIRD